MIKIKLPSFWKLVLSILICETTGLLSGLLSQRGMTDWFDTLIKPSWNPPSYLFGPVWITLYLLMAIAYWIIWKSNSPQPYKSNAQKIFWVQLFFNFLWSILFFTFQSPALALIDIILMLITIFITISSFSNISRKASWLLIPYFLWVIFASVLNYTIWSLNS